MPEFRFPRPASNLSFGWDQSADYNIAPVNRLKIPTPLDHPIYERLLDAVIWQSSDSDGGSCFTLRTVFEGREKQVGPRGLKGGRNR